MRSRSNGGVIGAYALPTQNFANGVFFIHDAAIYNTGPNPIWPLGAGIIYSASGGVISTAVDNPNYKLHTFTANGTFQVATGAAELEILIVGGGGAGGPVRNFSSTVVSSAWLSGGGGGGGVTLVRTFVQPGTTFTVEVGAGASVDTSDTTTTSLESAPGRPSKVDSTAGHSYLAYGGGSSQGYVQSGSSPYYSRARTATNGGSGAGGTAVGSLNSGFSNTNSLAVDPQLGYAGGIYDAAVNTSPSPHYQSAGGGGGANGLGKPGLYGFNVSQSGYGGDGYLWSRTDCYYGAGGGGARGLYWNTTRGYASQTRSRPGRSGPSATADSQTAGSGGSPSTSTGTSAGTSGYNGYGGGGGGHACSGSLVSVNLSSFGGSGTVIFCYRYQ